MGEEETQETQEIKTAMVLEENKQQQEQDKVREAELTDEKVGKQEANKDAPEDELREGGKSGLCPFCGSHSVYEVVEDSWRCRRCEKTFPSPSYGPLPKGTKPGLEARHYMSTTAQMMAKGQINPYGDRKTNRTHRDEVLKDQTKKSNQAIWGKIRSVLHTIIFTSK